MTKTICKRCGWVDEFGWHNGDDYCNICREIINRLEKILRERTRKDKKMTLKISGKCVAWLFVLVFMVCSYPANYYMMQNEWGWYNNNPEHAWTDGAENTHYGPSSSGRAALLAVSPFSAPINGLVELVETTYKTGD
jgi:hypothetical protein